VEAWQKKIHQKVQPVDKRKVYPVPEENDQRKSISSTNNMKYTKKELLVIAAVSPLLAIHSLCWILSEFFSMMTQVMNDLEVSLGGILIKIMRIKRE
jgi:hypothetical protein